MDKLQQQFKTLRLHGMDRCWQSFVETRRHHELDFAEGLEILLQAEEEHRKNNRFERLRKSARFRTRHRLRKSPLTAQGGWTKHR